MRWKPKTLKLLAGTAALVVLAGCSSSGDDPIPGDDPRADGAESLTVASARANITPSEEVYAYSVPKKLGFFDDEGLDVELVTADGSTAAIQTLASGSADIAFASSVSILAAIEQGLPIKAFAAANLHWPYFIGVPADSDIKTPADLKGKKVGVISLASASDADLRANLALTGVSEDDVDIIPVGSGTSAATALENGEIDAIDTFGDSYNLMENSGLSITQLDRPQEIEKLFSVTMVTTDDMLEENPEALVGYARSSYKGIVYSQTNKKEALQLGFDEFPVLAGADDPDGPEAKTSFESFEMALSEWLPDDPAKDPNEWGDWVDVPDERWQAVLDFAVDTDQISKELTLDEVRDYSLTDEYLNFDRTEIADLGK